MEKLYCDDVLSVWGIKAGFSSLSVEKRVAEIDPHSKVFFPRAIAKNIVDFAVVAKSMETFDAIREQFYRDDNVQIKETIVVVHGKVGENECKQLMEMKKENMRLMKIKSLGIYRTNNNETGYMSLLSFLWSPLHSVLAIKSFLLRNGYPVVGSGRGAIALDATKPEHRSKGRPGGTYAASTKFFLKHPISGKILEFTQKLPTKIMGVIEREQSFWEKETQNRFKILLDSEKAQECTIEELRNLAETRISVGLILGKIKFGKLEFKVCENVFIPHESSYSLVETAKEYIENHLKDQNSIHVLDLGIGSGCLLLSILSYVKTILKKEYKGTGIDMNESALKLAKENIELLDLESESINLVQADFLSSESIIACPWIDNDFPGYDIIICNPPYLKGNRAELLQPHSPSLAVSGCVQERLSKQFERGRPFRSCLRSKNSILIVEYPGNNEKSRNIIISAFQDVGGTCIDGKLDVCEMKRSVVVKFS